MPILENGAPVADPWTEIADDAALPASGPVIVSLARWRAERETLATRADPVGVRLPTGAFDDAIAGDLGALALVVVELPKFRDGRAFTVARNLRERHGFKGEIRATGHIIPDQYAFLTRCGVTSVAVPEGADLEQWRRSAESVTIAYQTAATDAEPLSPLKRFLRVG